MLVVYSIVQVLDLNVVSALISGVASIGHIILGVSLILILKRVVLNECLGGFSIHLFFDIIT